MNGGHHTQTPPNAAQPESVQLILIRPQDFPFVEAFREIIDSLQQGFTELGIKFRQNINRIEPGAVPIILGAHHLTPETAVKLPPETILYNLENLVEGYPWFSEAYLDLLRRFAVWDFSAHNIDILGQRGITSATHVPIGYSQVLERIPRIDEDIDVLFYGVLSPRRKVVLEDLGVAGIRVVALNGVFGPERDAWIARAKIVLNLHAAEGGSFEAARVTYLLANAKTVVSECNRAGEIDADLATGLVATPTKSIVDECRRLLADPDRRTQIGTRGRELMRDPSRSIREILKRALAIQEPN